MIKVGWIDFSSKDREKAMAVIDLMKENGAVDELGIGVVRDRLADLLFPGTSTIQTRAKYLFIVPWCMIEAEKNFKNKEDYLKRLSNIETDVIKALVKNEPSNTKGIIHLTYFILLSIFFISSFLFTFLVVVFISSSSVKINF